LDGWLLHHIMGDGFGELNAGNILNLLLMMSANENRDENALAKLIERYFWF
jgi:hypothetical protein